MEHKRCLRHHEKVRLLIMGTEKENKFTQEAVNRFKKHRRKFPKPRERKLYLYRRVTRNTKWTGPKKNPPFHIIIQTLELQIKWSVLKAAREWVQKGTKTPTRDATKITTDLSKQILKSKGSENCISNFERQQLSNHPNIYDKITCHIQRKIIFSWQKQAKRIYGHQARCTEDIIL